MKIQIDRKLKIRLLRSIQAGELKLDDYRELIPEFDFSVLTDSELRQLYELLTKAQLNKD